MKNLPVIVFAVLLSFASFGQNQEQFSTESDLEDGISPVFLKQTPFSNNNFSTVSEWWEFYAAFKDYFGGTPAPKNIYTLLFPDTVQSIYDNSGSYGFSRVRYHSVGVVFDPASPIMQNYGYSEISSNQPYFLDSIAIYYNYDRFTGNNIPDTLIVNIYKPQKLLYYKNTSSEPAGCSMKYDLAKNKGLNFSEEVKILLTNQDTINYQRNGKGVLYISLSSFNITAGSYGNPVGVTWTFKPGFNYNISDTLNSNFSELPHSKLNHFYFWNFTDYQDIEVKEYNNGVMIYSFWVSGKYKNETTNGPVYWRGRTFSNMTVYPMAAFKISYDPNWIGTEEINSETNNSIRFTENNTLLVNLQEPASVQLMNISGQKVFETSYSETGLKTIDLSNFPKGLYLAKIQTTEKVFSNQIIIR